MTEDPAVPARLPIKEDTVHQVVLPFKDQKAAHAVREQLSNLSRKISHTLQPVFKSRKICEDLKICESKPPLINQRCLVFNYQCDLCDAEYVSNTSRHLHKRIDEHRFSAIGKHLRSGHGINTVSDLTSNFLILYVTSGEKAITSESDNIWESKL